MSRSTLNERQLWALRFCLRVLDTCELEERVAVVAAIIALHIEAIAAATGAPQPSESDRGQ